MLLILHIITGGNAANTLDNVTRNTSYIYDIIFNKTLYIIDMILVLAIYASRKLYRLWNLLLKVLVFKILFMIGFYLSFLSYINIYNSMIDRTPSSFMPIASLCQNTYVETSNIFFVKNTDCPFKNSQDIMKDFAKSGSAWAYMSVMRESMDIKEKASLVLSYYESNKKFEETTWIEKNLLAVYKTSMLNASKSFYHRNKAAEVMIAKMILSGQESDALSKAKLILDENKLRKEDKSQYNFLYSLIKEKQK